MAAFITPIPLGSKRTELLGVQKSSISPHTVRALSSTVQSRVSRFAKTLLFYSPVRDFLPFMKSERPSPSQPLYLVYDAGSAVGVQIIRSIIRGKVGRVRAIANNVNQARSKIVDTGIDVSSAQSNKTLELIEAQGDWLEGGLRGVAGVVICQPAIASGADSQDDSLKNLIKASALNFEPLLREDASFSTIIEFSDRDQVQQTWGILDDVVMGGVSESNVRVDSENNLVLGGIVSTDNFGGFASARTANFATPLDLSEFDGLALRVRGDGNAYKLIVRCEQRWDGIAQCFTFPTQQGKWTTVRAPFESFRPVFRARTLKNGPFLDKKSIHAFQLMLSKFEYDGDLNPAFTPGPFEISVNCIMGYKDGEEAKCARLVQVSGLIAEAEEFPEVNQIIEDNVRCSGIPYCILRPGRIVEGTGVGLKRLSFQQGADAPESTETSSDDVARAVLAAFSRPEMNRTTVTIGRSAGSSSRRASEDLSEKFARLQKDNE